MSATYKATGINLKASPLGEYDRLLTILTKEFGLVRAVAPGSRKHQSSLRGRSGLFVINQLLIVKGRSLDKIIQAESLESFTGLGQDLGKLTAAQYLAELTLFQALSEQPQNELYSLLQEHLSRIEQLPREATLACLTQGIFHLLALAGLAPQVHHCCLTNQSLTPASETGRVGFNSKLGGVVLRLQKSFSAADQTAASPLGSKVEQNLASSARSGAIAPAARGHFPTSTDQSTPLNAVELALLQQLSKPEIVRSDGSLLSAPADAAQPSVDAWLTVERVLRHYAEYHLERSIRSASLVDSCFLSSPAFES
ncbi:MAG: DNA repair protein RecO [Leptolyngbyaceae cyanobacterium SL_7_1]|nr:DNA repair protein RecO [Leptolyngbyaceae cyanobacterium SL_7_1]